MSQAIDKVIRKREPQRKLDSALDSKRQRSKGRHQTSRLEMPPQKRRDKIRSEVGVCGAGERAARDTGPCRVAQPCLFDLVDAEVGRDGALETLVDEDLLAVFLGDFGGCYGAVWLEVLG